MWPTGANYRLVLDSVSATAVPEPAATVTMFIAAGAVLMRRRRRRVVVQ
jgi:hypothetical protein